MFQNHYIHPVDWLCSVCHEMLGIRRSVINISKLRHNLIRHWWRNWNNDRKEFWDIDMYCRLRGPAQTTNTSSVTKSEIFSLESFIMRLRPRHGDSATKLPNILKNDSNCCYFPQRTNWSKLFVLTGTSFVRRSFFCPGGQARDWAERSSLRATLDYSSNNFRQLGVRRCKNGPVSRCLKWQMLCAGVTGRTQPSSARQSVPSFVISCSSWAKAVLSQQDGQSVNTTPVIGPHHGQTWAAISHPPHTPPPWREI